MMLAKKRFLMATARRRNAVEIPGAIDFDGANDYLSRSSDLVGNADGKTFTFSAWVYKKLPDSFVYIVANTSLRFQVLLQSDGIQFREYNASGTEILNAQTAAGVELPASTWCHILFSVDLSSTTKRRFFIDDREVSLTYLTYTNDDVDFTQGNWAVGADVNNTWPAEIRLAHVYLDHTYRDLSIEANRRLFITDDLKPAKKADVAALNPILYLPLDDATIPGLNLGTGGDFALNGVVARSGRGPNEYNVAYSDLDGAADYLSRTTAPVGVADGKQFSCSFCCTLDIVPSGTFSYVFSVYTGTTAKFYIRINDGGELEVLGLTSAGAVAVQGKVAGALAVAGRNYSVTISVDVADAAKRHIYINGQTAVTTWLTYTNNSIDFEVATDSRYRIAANGQTTPAQYINGKLGDVWFDTTYIDLSANNPFWDSKTNKPANLGVNGEVPTGLPPLVYLPMRADNAGKNMGTGGDFTVNSGPFVGARSPSEFWGNKADFDGSTGYLARTSPLAGVSDGKTFSASFHVTFDGTGVTDIFTISSADGTGTNRLVVRRDASNRLAIFGSNAAGASILAATGGTLSATATNFSIQICIDLTNAANRRVYVNGAELAMTWATYSDDVIELTAARPTLGADYGAGAYQNFLDGKLSEFFFTTEYIDFSQEANRLKFRDAFGNPVDLGADGSKPTGRAPEIYMRLDPSNFGKNDGFGGDFTVNGTITDGGQL